MEFRNPNKEKELAMAKKKMTTVARSPAFGLFKDNETDWALRRTLEFMGEKAAEIGECLYAVRRIDETDGESWINEWADLAARVEALGDQSLAGGHAVSARECFLRASNYYRTAEYGTSPTHPRFEEIWVRSVESFREAASLFSPPIQFVDVHFEGKILPGYFWRPKEDAEKRPTLIAAGGNDSSLEEVVWWVGMAAVRRGYNFFTFDHPGHRGAVHRYNDCIKRADYELPYKVALDLLETLPGVDERLAMTGYSFGGYVTCRVAAYEKRLQAIAPNSPIIDAWEATVAFMGRFIDTVKKLPPFTINPLNTLYQKKMSKTPVLLAFKQYTDWAGGMYPTEMGPLEKLDAAIRFLEPFTVKEQLGEITAAALALVSDGDGEVFIKQAEQFIADVSSPIKKLHRFTMSKDGSDDHCQLDNRSRGAQVMFDFFDEVFDYRYVPTGL
jgi:dienelactone hydrolase